MHGDDFVSTGCRESLQWFKTRVEGRFEIKTKLIGTGEGESREEHVLNRVIRATEEGWEYEPDQRHGEIIVRAMKLEESKGVKTPGEEE